MEGLLAELLLTIPKKNRPEAHQPLERVQRATAAGLLAHEVEEIRAREEEREQLQEEAEMLQDRYGLGMKKDHKVRYLGDGHNPKEMLVKF